MLPVGSLPVQKSNCLSCEVDPLKNPLDTNLEVWILDNDKAIQSTYKKILNIRYRTRFFFSLKDFNDAFFKESYKCSFLIAELILPDGNFLDFIGQMKSKGLFKVPILIASFVDDLDVMRFCFKEGVLDYLTKPFRPNELLVKIENIFKKEEDKGFVNEENGREIILNGKKVNNLTLKQLQVLSLFLKSPIRSVNRKDILKKVWGTTSVHPKTVDVHLYNLRKKLDPLGFQINSHGPGKWALMQKGQEHLNQK